MTSIAALNSSLYRPLQNREKYDKYFPDAQCIATYLGHGVTTFGLHKMKEWTNLHYKQSEKIAKVLKGNSLQDTVQNIKKFLYNTIQYDADGYEQNLKSPKCAWSSKTADCKSYSLFAGSILKVLNISFKYRKITQPKEPKKWSHVYVVVKDKSGKELIIDGTVQSNKEVPRVKKEDLIMEARLPYYGLNAPETPVATSSVVKTNQEVSDAEILKGFKSILNYLKSKGEKQETLSLIESRVKAAYYRYKSFSFPFGLKSNGLLVDKEIIKLNTMFGMGGFFDDLKLNVSKPTVSYQGGSASINGAASLAANAILPGSGFLTGLIPNLGENIQAALKYGLNSWGASQTPESYPSSTGYKAYLKEIERIAKTINANNVDTQLTELSRYFSFLIYQHEYWRDKIGRAYSSRLAMNNAIVEFRKIRDRLIPKFIETFNKAGYKFRVTESESNKMMLWLASKTKFGRGYYKHNVYKTIQKPVGNPKPNNTVIPLKNTNTSTTSNNTTNTGNVGGKVKDLKKDNTPALIGLGIMGLILGGIAVKNMNTKN